MAYHLERFIDVTLPIGNPSTDISPVPAKSNMIATLSGAFDADQGGDAVPDLPHSISYTALSDGDTYAEWRVVEDALRALVGKRGWLYRRAEDNDDVQRAICKLLALTGQRATDDKMWKMGTLEFLQLDYWRGTYHVEWTLDAGYSLDDGLSLDDDESYTYTGPLTLTITNGGNARVTDAIITITAGGVAITDTVIAKSGESNLHFTGTIAAGTSLVIDCGSFSVLNNGVDAYANLTLDTGHVIGEWLRLDPGDNTITVTLTVANLTVKPTVTFEYMDAWA
jgi:hypothetical protein